MDEKILMAALAGLLHDVGKVEQRAKNDPWNPPEDVRDSGQPVHAAWSLRVAGLAPQKYRRAILAGGYHHQPEKSPAQDQFLSKLVALADKLSAGERSDLAKDSTTKKPPQQLVSIFDRILQDGDKRLAEHYLPVAPLTLGAIGAYIESDKKPAGNVRDQYDDLRLALESAVKQEIEDGETYLEHVLAEMQRLTWCVPSAYYHSVADVSLYDHSRMTAALAVCMADFPEAEIDRLLVAVREAFGNREKNLPDTPVAMLIGGDISGVQDFIYTITNKGATSALRGRSFYLQLLTEAAARFTLHELGLPITNIIYAGGGNFYILARASDRMKLPNLRQKLSRILYKHHLGDLYVAEDGILLKASDFMRPTSGKHPLSAKWGDLARQLALVKNSRFAELTENDLGIVFAPHGHGGNDDKQCQVCGSEHPETKVWDKDKLRDGEEGTRKCPACHSYEELGDALRDAQYIGWQFQNHPATVPDLTGEEIPGSYLDVLKDLGFSVLVADKDKYAQIATSNRVWALSDEALEKARPLPGQMITRRLLVNVTPHITQEEIDQLSKKGVDELPKAGSIKPFNALAAQSQGITRLGVFRADVDNLGKLFAEGLGNEATLSRIAALSFAFSLYFEGWVGVLAEKRNLARRKADLERRQTDPKAPLYGDGLYAIYSGGDDLFFVGAWHEVVELARDIRRDLGNYAAGHPGIHLSGGVVLVTEKYPLAKAARDAEQAEKQAKSYIWWRGDKPQQKNVFSFLGQPLDWDTFEQAVNMKDKLLEIEPGKRQSVVRKLLENYAHYAEVEEKRRKAGKDKNLGKPQTLYGPWNWRILYTLKRNLKDQKDFIETVSDPAKMEWLGVAARWAELKNRKATKEE
jgi:CRISPR-associated protein Csm1